MAILSSKTDLHSLTRIELYSVVDRLKRKNDYLKTDLLKFRLLSIRCLKYLEHFNELNQTNDYFSQKQLTYDLNILKTFNEYNCFVALNQLNLSSDQINDLNNYKELKEELTQREDNPESNPSEEWIERDINGMDVSNDETIDEIEDKLSANRSEETFNPLLNEPKNECMAKTNETEDLNPSLNSRNESKETYFSDNDSYCVANAEEWDDESLEQTYDEQHDSNERIESNDCQKSVNNYNKTKEERKPFGCDVEACSRVFATRFGLNRHKLQKHSEKTLICDSNRCHYKTPNERHLNKQKSKHTNDITDGLNGDNEDKSEEKDNKEYICDYIGCNKVLKNKYSFHNHKLTHSEKRYKCDHKDCSAVFSTKVRLSGHRAKHSSKFRCHFSECGFRAESLSQLNKHKWVHSGAISGEYKCELNDCNKEFKDSNNLRYHQLLIHANHFEHIPWLQCSRTGCAFKCKMQNILNKHIKSHNNGEYLCDWDGCGKVFKKERYLKCHKEIHSSSGKTIVCEECAHTFTTKSYLARHMLKHEGRFACDWDGCSYKARDNNDLKRHKAVHTDGKYFVCDVKDCGKQYNYENVLRTHQLRAHPNEYISIDWMECSETGCDFRTKSKTDFREHSLSHKKPFVCDVCDKGFAHKKTLRDHKLIHTGNTDSIRKLACDWYGCDQRFRNNSALKEHMNMHLGLKPFKCVWPSCEHSYSLKKSLTKHMKRHDVPHLRCSWPDCAYQTSIKFSMQKHMKTHAIKV